MEGNQGFHIANYLGDPTGSQCLLFLCSTILNNHGFYHINLRLFCSVCLFVGGEKRNERNKVVLLGNPTSIISVAGRPTTRGLPADLSIAPAHFTRAGFLRSTSLPSLISYQRKEIRSAIERNHVDRQENLIQPNRRTLQISEKDSSH